jgi:hypothetical protein
MDLLRRRKHLRLYSRQELAISFLLLSLTGCNHTVRVAEQMTWECAPDRYMSQYPDAQPVRFRFVEDPRFEDVVSGRGLCDQLRRSGKSVASVEFEAWGNSRRGLQGYRETAVDGKPIIDVGGWTSSGASGRTGPHPLERLFK